MIHDDHPFSTPPDQRDPVRQFRGRLAGPVTVVTAGGPDRRTGLTVSSLMIAEGEPSYAFLLLGLATDLIDTLAETGRLVVHVVDRANWEVADRFAAVRPSPGGPFAGLDVVDGEWGPELELAPTRIYCRVTETTELAYHALVRAEIVGTAVADLIDPSVYFRGGYRDLRPKS